MVHAARTGVSFHLFILPTSFGCLAYLYTYLFVSVFEFLSYLDFSFVSLYLLAFLSSVRIIRLSFTNATEPAWTTMCFVEWWNVGRNMN